MKMDERGLEKAADLLDDCVACQGRQETVEEYLLERNCNGRTTLVIIESRPLVLSDLGMELDFRFFGAETKRKRSLSRNFFRPKFW